MKSLLQGHSDKKNIETAFSLLLEDIYSKKSNSWSKIHEKQMLSVFNESYSTVIAYKKFIDDSRIVPKKIVTEKDFTTIPSVSKKNYLRVNKWEDLCKRKSFSKNSHVMTSTSGSTGEPFYFPRTDVIDLQASFNCQMFLESSKISKNKSTLVIDCLGMGVWIGGLIIYQAFKYISERGYAITVITPGVSKTEILKAVKNLGHQYEQIILCGYPPFIKDVIDQGKDEGIVWSKYSIKIIFAAECFSESFRDYIIQETGIKDTYRDTMNIYGSADLGAMAQETPVAILLRRLALSNQKLYMRLFGQATRLPTLAQYIPWFINFESHNGSIYCTGDNVLPLVRYEIGDNGGVFSYKEVEVICKEEGIDLREEAMRVGISDTLSELPFVYVYERSDFSASYYGALIYPEYIKKALVEESITPFISGKFTMYTRNDEQENQYLEINIEMKQNQKVTPVLRSKILKLIHTMLIKQSSEYSKIAESLGKKAFPKVVFWTCGHETHFLSGIKQKWVKKV